MKPKSARFSIFAASSLAITVVHAIDYDYTGASGGSWGLDTNWMPTGVPVAADSIVVNKDITAVTTVNYALAPDPATTRSITSISVTDTFQGTDNPSPTPDVQSMFNYTIGGGVAGSQLEFATNTPAISTNIVNFLSGAQRLVVVNPLVSLPSTTIAFGGVGNSAFEFNVADGNTAFNSNVTGLTCASTGIVLLNNKVAATPIALPDFDFSSNNNKLVLSGGPFSITGKTVNTGTGGLTAGGGASVTLGSGTSFNIGNLVMSSNNSAEFYVNGSATVNVDGASGVFANLNIGQNMSSSGTSSFNVIDGAVVVTGGGTTLGAPNNTVSTNAVQNLNLNVSGGSLTFSQGSNFDVNIGRSERSTSGTNTTLTVNGAMTVSNGLVDMGSFGRLVVGRSSITVPGNSANDNTTGKIVLDGGELRMARAITRGTYSAGQSGTDYAQVILNGGKITPTLAIADLFVGFTAVAADGIFISIGGAVIDTNGLATGIAGKLQENVLSTGGGLTKQGANTLTLTNTANTFTGSIALQGGTLSFNNAGALGVGSAAITQSAGTSIRPTGSVVITRPIVTAGHNANVFNPTLANTVSISGGISQDPGYTPAVSDVYGIETFGTTIIDTSPLNIPDLQVNKAQAGTLEMNVAGNTFKRMWIYTGAIKTGVAGALDPDAEFDLRTTASILDLNGFNQTVASLTGSTASGLGSSITSVGAATLTISPASGSSTYAGTISGALGITKSGAGTQILSGPNTYSGETIVSEGILGLPTDDTLSDTAAVRIASSGATLDLTYTGSDVVSTFYIGGVQQASGLWGRIGSIVALGAAHESGLITGDGLLSVTTGGAGGSFTTWASTNGVTGGPNGDSDNDGIPNLVEYALNLNPAGSDGSAGTFVGNTLSFNKRAEAVTNGDVTYVIEASTDLGISDPWTPVTPTTNTSSVISYLLPSAPAKNFARFSTTVAP